jgi:hypothetical protein
MPTNLSRSAHVVVSLVVSTLTKQPRLAEPFDDERLLGHRDNATSGESPW